MDRSVVSMVVKKKGRGVISQMCLEMGVGGYILCVCAKIQHQQVNLPHSQTASQFSQTVIPTLVIAQWLRAQILGIECSWDLSSGESTQGAPATQ